MSYWSGIYAYHVKNDDPMSCYYQGITNMKGYEARAITDTPATTPNIKWGGFLPGSASGVYLTARDGRTI
jgi:hypothetical protein